MIWAAIGVWVVFMVVFVGHFVAKDKASARRIEYLENRVKQLEDEREMGL